MDTRFLSQREEIESALNDLLVSMSYPNSDAIRNGLLDVIGMVSDYHEEGEALFPNILLVKSDNYFKTFNSHRIRLSRNEIKRHEFSQSIKMCAPLAVDGWSIYIIVSEQDNTIEYGVLTAELEVLSLDLYEQTMDSGTPEINALFLRNVGNKVVEIRDVQHQLLVILNLSEEYTSMGENVKLLVDNILGDSDQKLRETKNFLAKIIQNALNEGHGNLIAVVKDVKDVINTTLQNLHGGILLEEPLDIKDLACDYQKFKTEETSVKLRSYSNLMQSMLNFDGITLFSDNGKVLGYHFIVNNNAVTDEDVVGGSRTRAFLALSKLDCIKACFMKSQDGKVKFHSK